MNTAERKRIAIVSPHHWTGSYGGAEYQISLLIGELSRLYPRYELHYLCKASDNHIVADDHSIHGVAKEKWFSKYGTFFDAPGLYRRLKSLQPHCIYQRVGCSYTGVCAHYAKARGINMIWHIAHDLDVRPAQQPLLIRKPHHWLEKKILEYGIRHSPMIVAQKQSQADDLNRYYGRKATAVIANFQPLPQLAKDHTSQIHVVWISNHKREKNPEVFIDLAEQLAPRVNARFTMAGRPAPTPWGQAVVERARQSQAINFVGELKQEDINDLLETAHLMVNTSDFEGFPNTFIQSWMREVPVISLNVDPDGVLTRHGTGILTGNSERLLEATAELIQDREKRIEMAKNARRYSEKAHSLKNAAQVIRLLIN